MVKIILKLSLFLAPLILLLTTFKVNYSQFIQLPNILMGSIALSSSSLGFFIAGVSILQTSNLSKFYDKLVQLGTDKKILGWLMTSIFYMFLLSATSLLALFFIDGTGIATTLLLNIWLALLIASILSMFFIIFIFIIVFLK
ncbi:hypothetical protein AWU65_20365 [Paenibacillus glucanolyticus]|uniref:Uncharacterized protein n=1 Tax=Paenibacillus glucanolyticus TaxID=59843 RepID=A0A163LGG7_9BACL|nr:hypothetical protein [Paenibacillus glucanolyticus]KZS48112.1 hypothetical protein AWU65_20365 [Paenibacillus glucanolyticus]